MLEISACTAWDLAGCLEDLVCNRFVRQARGGQEFGPRPFRFDGGVFLDAFQDPRGIADTIGDGTDFLKHA